jgi:ubiquinone/menaquinone biosynthesis C-methylase UbiE
MGQTDEERQRLIQQSAHLAPLTELMLRESGLAPGMSVLDIGCGTGGASQIAARIVGPTGRVTGLDRDEATLAIARDLAAHAGLKNISFVAGTAESTHFEAPFDAVIGRFVLIHQKDPLAVVRSVVPFARNGGIVAFLEPDFSPRVLSWPRMETFELMCAHVTELFVRANLPHDMGLRLRKTFHDAGVKDIRQKVDSISGGGHGHFLYRWLAATIATLAPKLEAARITTTAALDLATLETRLNADAAHGGHVQMFPLVAAWGTK